MNSDFDKTGWQTFKLGELVNIKYGKDQKKVKSDSGKFPIYGTGGLMGFATKFLYDKPSVLIGRKGSISKVKFVDKPFWTVDTLFYTEINENLVLPRFFYYALSLIDFAHYNEGTTIPSLRTETLNKLEINLPPLEIQKKIAAVLSALDDKIETNNAINKNLEQQAQIFYEMACEGAKISPLSNIIESIESGSRPKGGAETSGIPSIGAEKIEKFGLYDYSQEKFINEDYFKRMRRGIIKSGDVMLYKDGAYTGKSSMALNGFPYKICAVNEHVFLIRTKNKAFQFFLYFTLQNETVRKKIFSLASSKAAQPGLNQKELLSVEAPLPEESIIQKFEAEISHDMQLIALNALENKKLAEMRDLLLPCLLNGEIDVSEVKI